MRELIIAPALKVSGLWSESAEILVYGTGMVESQYAYLKQMGGPALSFFQIEPETHSSIKAYLNSRFNKALWDRVTAASFMSILPDDDALIYNLRYAAIICRLVYYRSPCQLPEARDAKALSMTHKKVYNTMLGKADPAKNAVIFQDIIDGKL